MAQSSSERSSLNSSRGLSEQWPLIVAFCAFILGIVGVLALSLTYGLTGGYFLDDYGLVIDAGSSKTNSILYKWRSDKNQGTGCVSQVDSDKVLGGIAEADIQNLDPVLNSVKKVASQIYSKYRNDTPLYFAATAGMRLLNKNDPEKATAILRWLNQHLPEVGLSLRNVEIISGVDEGIYGWITANFLEKTLETPQIINPWTPTTLGALDMGGASMQIAYAVSDQDTNANRSKGLMLYGQNHKVFSISNLCYGREESQRRYRCLVIQEPKQSIQYDPCLPLHAEYKMSGIDCNTHCTKSPSLVIDPTMNFTFKGTSDYKACVGNVSLLLNKDHCDRYRFADCFQYLSNIPADQKYLAFASYFYTADFLSVIKSSLKEYRDASNKLCMVTKEELAKDYPKNRYSDQFCFNSVYILQVLTTGFGFTDKTWSNIQFVNTIAGKDVGWSLGYMINATNLIPEKARVPRLFSSASLAVGLIIFLIVIAGGLFLFLRSYKSRSRGGAFPVLS